VTDVRRQSSPLRAALKENSYLGMHNGSYFYPHNFCHLLLLFLVPFRQFSFVLFHSTLKIHPLHIIDCWYPQTAFTRARLKYKRRVRQSVCSPSHARIYKASKLMTAGSCGFQFNAATVCYQLLQLRSH